MLDKLVFENAKDLTLKVIGEMHDGKRSEGIVWHEDLTSGKATVKEMIGTDDGSREFIEKITYDMYSGREGVALLYKEIYTPVVDSNLPQTLTEKEFGPVQVVFLQKLEGGEVKFGALGPGTEKTVSLYTWAAGIEYDEDMIEYNQTWRISDIGVGFGEAYNKLLNHLHLSPIISGTYVTSGGGIAAQKTAQKNGTAQLIAWNTDLATTLLDAITVLPAGSLFLVNSSNMNAINIAVAAAMYADFTPNVVKQKIAKCTFVEYDGDEITVGGKTYTYAGVTAGYAYFLKPKTNFKEYIKHDLRVDSGDGDLSRLIVTQLVGRARRGVLAALGGKTGAVKIDITA